MNDDLSIYQMKITTFPIENFIMHSEKYILKINTLNSKIRIHSEYKNDWIFKRRANKTLFYKQR